MILKSIKRNLTTALLISLLIILVACAPLKKATQPTITTLPTNPVNLPTLSASLSADELGNIIEASNPLSSTYDTGSPDYAEFQNAIQALVGMGLQAVDAVDDLAVALAFPRPDAYLAGQALIELGPDITATDLPWLLDNLLNSKPEVRMYSVIVLGSIGKNASCGVGKIGPLLWDSDAYVRSATASTLESITGKQLVQNSYLVTPDLLSAAVQADTPEGKVVGDARTWWTNQGSKVNWHPSYDLCDP